MTCSRPHGSTWVVVYHTRWALALPIGDPLVCRSVCPSGFTLHAATMGASWALSLEDLCLPSGL